MVSHGDDYGFSPQALEDALGADTLAKTPKFDLEAGSGTAWAKMDGLWWWNQA